MFPMLLEATLRSWVLVAAVWLLLKVFRLADPRFEKFIWTAVILMSLALPLLMRSSGFLLPAQAFSLQIAGRFEAVVAARSRQAGIVAVLWDVYLLVTGILIARFLVGLWNAARLCRAARRVYPRWASSCDVRVCDQLRSPASFGSTLLLPADWQSWEARKLRAVIAHESAHIQQYDCYRLWLASLYGAVFWVNPAAMWLRRRLTVLAELTSDEAAVAVTGDRIGYAEVLLNMVTDARPHRATIGMARPTTLTRRLKRLLESDMLSKKLGRSGEWLLMTAIAVSAATAAFGAAVPLVLTEAQDSAVPWVSGVLFYPPELKASHVEGMVVCRVTIDASGQVVDAMAVSEKPADSGLALAAVETVKTFHFNNTLSRPVIKTLAVHFKLD